MRLNNKNLIVLFIIILLVLLFFLDTIVSLIPSYEAKLIISIILFLAVFVFLIYAVYNDIRKRQFTTTTLIVITDIINLITFIVISYTLYNNMYKVNTEILLKKYDIETIALLVLLSVSILQNYLKSDRFKRG